MYARVGQFEYKPKNEQAVVQHYSDNLASTKSQAGFRHILLLTNAGKAMSISLWDSKEDCLATESRGGSVQQAMAAVSRFYTKSPIFSYFDVRVDENGA